jgi:arginine decarboxylase
MTSPDSTNAPLVAAVRAARESRARSMQIPGHKGRYAVGPEADGESGAGADPAVPLFGADVLTDLIRDDVALQGFADDNHFTHGWLVRAEQLYATAIGADHTRFLVGGSSQGNIAALLTAGQPGRVIAVDRTSHRSALAGLVLSGAVPQWIFPVIHPEFGIPLGVPAAAVEAMDSDPTAVFVTTPAYVGTISDVTALAAAAHARDVPLVVDQAWGAHLDWRMNQGALRQGADLVVTSIHKALTGYSQTAIVSCRTQRIDISRLDRSVDITATTSPSATLMASIDATRFALEQDGGRALDRAITFAESARAALRRVPGLVVLDDTTLGTHVDPLKIALFFPGTGTTGTSIAMALWRHRIGIESADTDTLVASVGLVDDEESLATLVDIVSTTIEADREPARSAVPSATWQVRPDVVMTPREAMFATRRRVDLIDAVGEVSAEQFCPYPPGVPLIAPGERVTAELIEAIRLAGANGRVAYCSDPTLRTIEVVAD